MAAQRASSDPTGEDGARVEEVGPAIALVCRWVDAIEQGDLDGASDLYRSDSSVHVAGRTLVGRAEIREYLRESPLLGAHLWNVEVEGNGMVEARWESLHRLFPPGRARFRVGRAGILEQWIQLSAGS